MRVAAGVLFIIIALANLAGGLVYAGLGGLLGMGGEAVEQGVTVTVTDQETGEVSEEEIRDEAVGREAKKAGGKFVLWGLFLVVLAGLNIAAAVMLFQGKNANFVMTVAGLEVLADVGAMAVIGGAIWPTLGILTAVLALFAAKDMGSGDAAVA